jgi:hypothetical protein
VEISAHALLPPPLPPAPLPPAPPVPPAPGPEEEVVEDIEPPVPGPLPAEPVDADDAAPPLPPDPDDSPPPHPDAATTTENTTNGLKKARMCREYRNVAPVGTRLRTKELRPSFSVKGKRSWHSSYTY